MESNSSNSHHAFPQEEIIFHGENSHGVKKSGKSVDPRLLTLLKFFKKLFLGRREFFGEIFPGIHQEFGKIGAVLSKEEKRFELFKGRGLPPYYRWEASSEDPKPELGAIFLNTDTVRAKAIVVNELPLFRKLGSNNYTGARTEITFGGHPEGCQGTKDDLHNGGIIEILPGASSLYVGRLPRAATVQIKTIIPARSVACTAVSVQKEPILKYHTPFSQEIEGIDSPKKLVPPRFTLYDGKSDPRSHVSHVRQMMALWNHMDALMCQDLMSRVKMFARLEDDVKHEERATGLIARVSIKAAMKEVQLIEQDHEVLEDVVRDPEAKVVEDLICYELDEPSLDCFFLIGIDPNFIKHELNILPDAQLIAMHEPDQEKTTFITPRCVFYNKVMPFGLKNADPTYYMIVTKIFEPILGKIMDAYIDDIVVKSKEKLDHISDEMWDRGHPEQITAINNLVSLKNTKEVQKLIGMAAALNRFIRTRVVLKSKEGAIFEQCLRLNFPTTNKEAEYEAFIAGLRSSSKIKVPELHIFSVSKLVVNQVIEKFEARGAKMAKYLAVAKNLLKEFRAVKIEQVEKDSNAYANALAGLESIFEGEIGRTIAVELISAPSHETVLESIFVNTELVQSWIDPFVNFLQHDKLPENKREFER
ncbi:hypothetical protein Acr_24g0008200 [Actinidia rufa]|uniref:RNase H type-1 domain-containing protein n=1 Tax=Actinidia rufa TaxID=165716 RepID=A0A7J0GUW0_9ERIC|nr:hypothetical protein Acr_24g0008200 [Actinidia rufa]